MTEQELVEPKTNELAVFDEVAQIIAKWKVENEKLVFEYDTPQGEKDARSHIAKLRKVKTKVGEIHKEAKAESRAFGLKLDAKKNEHNGEVDEMITYHKDPLDKIAAEKQAVIDAEIAKAEAEEEKRLADIDARERAVEEAERRATKREEEANREEREKQIAADAAETARVQAEAKAKAEADAKELAEKKAKEAEEAANMKRIANKRNRQKVEGNIHYILTEIGLSEDDATLVLEALKENRIPHVSINY